MTLTFTAVKSPEDFYEQLKKQSAKKNFGGNLDALYDFMTTDLKGAAQVIWPTYEADVTAHAALRAVRGVLLAAAKERSDLSLDWN
jgi:RNAse (barnase) inhibitor barstar